MVRGLSAAALLAVLFLTIHTIGCSSGSSPSSGGGDDAGGDDGGTCLLCANDGSTHALKVDPPNAMLVASGPGATQPFTASIDGKPVTAQWTIDSGSIGMIDTTGVFSTSGLVAGKVTVEAQAQGLHGQAVLTVVLHLQDNPGNIPPSVQQQLLGGGNADAGFGWLYPYDGTVFPRGLLAPTLQLGGAPADATYVHVFFSTLDYQGFYGPSSPTQVAPTQQLWKTITESASGTDNVKIQVTKISGGMVSGPVTETWKIAQGSLKGTVYYESRYSSPNDNGATMRIKPGAPQPDVLLGNCNVCHYVSADGSTIVADLDVNNVQTSAAYSLTNNESVISQQPDGTYVFAALYKDGSLLVTNSGASHLYDVKTGMPVAAPGWDGVVSYAALPSFSPDGKMIVFNHEDTGMGHSLAVMNFAVATHTFSGLKDIANDPVNFLGWPTFTPDDKWVVYENDTRDDFGTRSAVTAGSGVDAKSDLQVAHLPSGTTAQLDRVNGFLNGNCTLPFGDVAEGHMNYDPTILPVAAGGYFWVVFTSRREYGNTINNPDPYYDTDNRTPGALPWRKKLWVAALDIDDPEHPSPKAHDISHPAFYLPGQDLQTGNYRGFWALDPCQGNGVTCESGDQCCSGFCRQTNGDAGPIFTCVPPQGCAQEYEKCTTDADCCAGGTPLRCINGFCAQSAPK